MHAKEIRVRWRSAPHGSKAGRSPDGTLWFPDTDPNRRHLTSLIDAGNDLEGEASYWLEVRQSETDRPDGAVAR